MTDVRQVTLKSTPRTVHLVRAPMLSVKEGVTTWCGRFGFPREPSWSTWRHCVKCQNALELHVGDSGGKLVSIDNVSEPGVAANDPGSDRNTVEVSR